MLVLAPGSGAPVSAVRSAAPVSTVRSGRHCERSEAISIGHRAHS